MLPNYYSYKLCCYGNELNNDQKKIFFDRLGEFNESVCDVIYRREKKSRMLLRYNLNNHDIPTPFCHTLFLIGSKGAHFLKDLNSTIEKAKQRFNVNDTSDEFFIYIFDKIDKLISGYEIPLNSKKSFEDFKTRERSFITFFKNPENKIFFLQGLKTLDKNQKIFIRDYYLTFLHHLIDSEYYPISFLLSVTTNFLIAKKFTEKAKQDQDDLIFMGWIPKNRPRLDISTFSYLRPQNPITTQGLPLYTKPVFHKQNEITLKGGLLPHYLLGYLYTDKSVEHFEINPYLFEIKDDQWIKEGLPIDQKHFWKKLKDTNIEGGFYVDKGEYNEMRF